MTEDANSPTSPLNFVVRCVYGSVKPVTFFKFENGRMVSYSYAIHLDREGNETHRTEPEPLGSIGYDDGTPFTETDYLKFKDT